MLASESVTGSYSLQADKMSSCKSTTKTGASFPSAMVDNKSSDSSRRGAEKMELGSN
jgi:hypothetical protein